MIGDRLLKELDAFINTFQANKGRLPPRIMLTERQWKVAMQALNDKTNYRGIPLEKIAETKQVPR